MNSKINSLLAITISALFILSSAVVFASTKPVVKNPGNAWPGTTTWGSNLTSTDGTYTGVTWYGEGTATTKILAPPDPPTGEVAELLDATYANYGTWVQTGASSDYTWQASFRKTGVASLTTVTVSSVMDNSTSLFIPEDFSVTLENASNSPSLINLRAGSAVISGLPKLYALVLDNAVNITSVTTVDPLTGPAGDPLPTGISVTVSNTGHLTDTYTVTANAGSVSTGAITAGNSATVTVPAVYPTGAQAITIEAVGTYASDEDSSLTLTGLVPIVVQTENTGFIGNYAGSIPSWEYPLYTLGTYPTMVAKRIGAGAVVAAGFDAAISKYRMSGYSTSTNGNYEDNLDVLLDATFQWMVPGATKILWYAGDNIYSRYKNQPPYTGTTNLINALTAKGYSIYIDNRNIDAIAADNLSSYDILVFHQEEILPTDYTLGLGGSPMDPFLTNAYISAITNFEASGKGVFVLEASDSFGDSWNRVANRILDALNFGWWFNHDETYDNTRFYDAGSATYEPYMQVVAGNPIADNFISQVGTRDNMLSNEIGIYSAPTLFQPVISATITSPNIGATEGTNGVTDTVTITNTGNAWDNYTLSVSDTLGWNPVLSSTLTGMLNPGDSTTVNVTVDIPSGTGGQVDVITVQAQSFDAPWRDNFVGSETVTSISHLAAVEVTILPDPLNPDNIAHASSVGNVMVDPAWKYDPLTFAVKVSNKGALDDKYDLTVSGPAGMGLKLTPDELYVPSGDNEYVSLSVTLPDTWLGGVSGTITVTAVGQLSSENQAKLYPTDNDSVTVTAGIVDNVAKWVLPDTLEPQTGAPGSPLVWVLVLKNTGNIAENLSVSLSEALTGVSSASAPRTSWGAVLDNDSWLNVPAGTKVQTYLRVTVPSDAKTSEWDTINIVADDSATVGPNNTATDIEYVMAHAVEPGPQIPEGVIEISVEAQIIAIEVWPSTFNFGVLDEEKTRNSIDNYGVTFTVRNTGNVAENILVAGTDAQSMPGEPVTTWTLSNVSTGLDQYQLEITPDDVFLTTSPQQIWGNVAEGAEQMFGLTIYTPTSISTPARMWARIKLTAIAAVPPV